MVISSRTPEGDPHCCPVCGCDAAVEPSYPGGDSCCPSCGQLLWWFRDRCNRLGISTPQPITIDTTLFEAAQSSLDIVEIVMELEGAFDVTIPADDAALIRTIGDALRCVQQRRRQSKNAAGKPSLPTEASDTASLH